MFITMNLDWRSNRQVFAKPATVHLSLSIYILFWHEATIMGQSVRVKPIAYSNFRTRSVLKRNFSGNIPAHTPKSPYVECPQTMQRLFSIPSSADSCVKCMEIIGCPVVGILLSVYSRRKQTAMTIGINLPVGATGRALN